MAMGIVRTTEWTVKLPLEQTDARLRAGLEKIGDKIEGPVGRITATTKGNAFKNRGKGKLTAECTAAGEHTEVVITVDALGTGHEWVFEQLSEALGADSIDDRGLTEAVSKLGRSAKFFGREAIQNVRTELRRDERVVALVQGAIDDRASSVAVLTTKRLFFYKKGVMSSSFEEFPLKAISSMTLKKAMTGEAIEITASNAKAKITTIMHGYGEAFVRAYWELTAAPSADVSTSAAAPAEGTQPDVLAQLEQLGKLHAAGVLTEVEFAAKKAELLARL